MTRSVLFGAAFASTATAAAAQSTNDVLPGCRNLLTQKAQSTSDALMQGRCAGIVEGIVFMGGLVRYILKSNPVPPDRRSPIQQVACIDVGQEVLLDQKIKVVIAYIDARPAQMHEDFRGLAFEALHATWPCL